MNGPVMAGLSNFLLSARRVKNSFEFFRLKVQKKKLFKKHIEKQFVIFIFLNSLKFLVLCIA